MEFSNVLELAELPIITLLTVALVLSLWRRPRSSMQFDPLKRHEKEIENLRKINSELSRRITATEVDLQNTTEVVKETKQEVLQLGKLLAELRGYLLRTDRRLQALVETSPNARKLLESNGGDL